MFAQLISCINSASNLENISIDSADTIFNGIVDINNKEKDVEYYYKFNSSEAGAIHVRVKTNITSEFDIVILDSNLRSIGEPSRTGDGQYYFETRCPIGTYYLKIMNVESSEWSARLSYIVDNQFIEVRDYQKYIQGNWKLLKTCETNNPINCEYSQYSEITKYFKDGTDSIILSGGAWGGGYGPFNYRFEGDSLINTNASDDPLWMRIDRVVMKLDTLSYISGDKPDQIFVNIRIQKSSI